MSQLLALVRVFSYLSLLTVGGGLAAFPEMKKLVVDVHHWLSFTQLIHLYSMGQVAPGPNMMMIVAIGEWVYGIPGVVVVLIAFFAPTALLALLMGRLWKKLETWRWRASLERGLWGALTALVAICLPGGVLMLVAGLAYHAHGGKPTVTAALKGVAAAAIGLILATTIQLGKRSLAYVYDLVFVGLTVFGVDQLHQSVPRVLIVVGILAVLWYRPRKPKESPQ